MYATGRAYDWALPEYECVAPPGEEAFQVALVIHLGWRREGGGSLGRGTGTSITPPLPPLPATSEPRLHLPCLGQGAVVAAALRGSSP